MKPFVVFLNELSCSFDGVQSFEITNHVISTIKAIREVKRIRPDVIIASPLGNISRLPLCNGEKSLSSVLGGNSYKDEWRFLKNLDQSCPWDEYPNIAMNTCKINLYFEGIHAIGMTWAHEHATLILSFGYPPHWTYSNVNICLDSISSKNTITINNLSRPEHAKVFKELLTDYGHGVSSSSLIYTGNDFVIRMYLNDHDPAHFHVLENTHSGKTLAKIDINTLDTLSGKLDPRIKKRVGEWARQHQTTLRNNWVRCRTGSTPICINA